MCMVNRTRTVRDEFLIEPTCPDLKLRNPICSEMGFSPLWIANVFFHSFIQTEGKIQISVHHLAL